MTAEPEASAKDAADEGESVLSDLRSQIVEAHQIIGDLRDRDSLKTQFLSNIAHDLRTPLTAIITHAEILRDGLLGEMNVKQRESVGTIITGGRQLLDMIAEILLYAKGSSEPLTVEARAFHFQEVVGQVIDLNQSLVARKQLALECVVPDDLPFVDGDRDKIMHVHMTVGDQVLMGSDAPPGHFEKPQGFSVSLGIDDPAEAERVFNALAEGAQVTMPLQKTFWADRFGMLVDRYGTPWMVNCQQGS